MLGGQSGVLHMFGLQITSVPNSSLSWIFTSHCVSLWNYLLEQGKINDDFPDVSEFQFSHLFPSAWPMMRDNANLFNNVCIWKMIGQLILQLTHAISIIKALCFDFLLKEYFTLSFTYNKNIIMTQESENDSVKKLFLKDLWNVSLRTCKGKNYMRLPTTWAYGEVRWSPTFGK